jgi:RNA polymerase sigma-70 factor (ECF subfamily)
VPADLGVSYRQHLAPVWRYVRARLPSDDDADDVTSDVFIRALRSWHTYDPAEGAVRGWLIGIARHAVADHWRRSAPEEPVADTPERLTATVGRADDVEALALAACGHDDLRRELGRLSGREREALALRFGAELPSAEIGAVLGISATAARMLVHRAVTKLRGVRPDA